MGAPFQPGDVIDGKYRVDRIIGEGGMGVVLAATRVALGDQVALKCMRGDLGTSPERLARFTREARAAVKIRSEHVVRIIDVGSTGGVPYIVMDLLEGEDLSQLLGRTRCRVPEAVDLLLQACDAVSAAHRAGVIHRDLKPANLFLTRRPSGAPMLKVLDFGISKLAEEGLIGGKVTESRALLGSPRYMSPEQLRSSRDVDPRSDVWSLGVIAFELVAGRPPFDFDSVAELCSAILNDPAPPLGALPEDIPEAYAAIVAKCLEKDPACRCQSVDELADALRTMAAVGPATRRLDGAVATPGAPDEGSSRGASAVAALATTEMAEATSPPTVPWTPVGSWTEIMPAPVAAARPTATLVAQGARRVAVAGGGGRQRALRTVDSPLLDAEPIPLVRKATVSGPAHLHSAGSMTAVVWPPPTRSGWAWVGFALGALLVLAALVALVGARLGMLAVPF